MTDSRILNLEKDNKTLKERVVVLEKEVNYIDGKK